MPANRVWPEPAGTGVAERDYADCGVRRLWCALHYALADRSEEELPALPGAHPGGPERSGSDRAPVLGSRAMLPRAEHTVNDNAPADLLARPLLPKL